MTVLARKRRRDIRRQRWQFASVLTTVVLGVMLFCASYDAYLNLYVSYNGTYDRLRFADATVVGADESFNARARGIEGVETVVTRQVADVPLRVGDRVLLGRVVGMPTRAQPGVDQVDVVDGRYLRVDSTEEAMAETHFAKTYDLSPGDDVEMLTASGWQRLRLVAEVVSPEYLWPARSSQQLLESPEDFGVLFVPDDLVPFAATQSVDRETLVLYDSSAPVQSTDGRVRRAADAAGGDDVVFQADQPSNKALSLDLQGFEQMSWLFPVMFLLAAGLAAYLLLTRLVYSQRSEVGTLRANGLSGSAVLRHYLSYGLWVGIWGAVVGVALGVPLGWAITGAYTAELGIPDTLRELRLVTPLVGLAFGVVAGLVSVWVPARAAGRVEPAEAMRGDLPAGGGGRSALERAVPALGRLPARWLMVLRGFGRNRRRSLSSVVGIVLALTLLLTSWDLLDTTEILLDEQFNEIQLEDAQALPSRTVDEALLRAVGRVDGVDSVEQVWAVDVSVSGGRGSYSTQLLAFKPDTVMHRFDVPGGRLPEKGLVVGASIPGETGAEPGERVTVRSSSLGKRFEMPVAAVVDEPLGTLVYASQPALEDALRSAGVGDPAGRLSRPGYSLAMMRFAPGADRSAVVERVRGLDEIATVSDSRLLYNLVQDYLGFFYVFVGMMLVFGGTIALALIFNTVSVNLAERSSELASMRANGMSRRLIARLLTAENLILTAVGIVPGLVVGTLAAAWFMGTYSSDLFSFPLRMKPSTYVLSALAMFGVTALSLLPGIRAVGRVDIARVVRERSQ